MYPFQEHAITHTISGYNFMQNSNAKQYHEQNSFIKIEKIKK